jgi:hypothetical protein
MAGRVSANLFQRETYEIQSFLNLVGRVFNSVFFNNIIASRTTLSVHSVILQHPEMGADCSTGHLAGKMEMRLPFCLIIKPGIPNLSASKISEVSRTLTINGI